MTNTMYKSEAGERAVIGFYENLLTHWPAPSTPLTVGTRHGDTFVMATGDPAAPPLVLLHGASSNMATWLGEVAEYSRDFQVFAVDLPGEPGKSAQNRPPWTGPAYAEWLEDLLGGLGIGKVSLVGLSLGGWAAMKFAAMHPERVSKLVVLAPGGVAPIRLSFLLRAIPLSMLGRRGVEAANRLVLGRQPIHPDAIEFMNLVLTHVRPRLEGLPLLTDTELRRLTMPTLVIAGAQDALLPSAKTAARMKQLLPNLTVDLLPDVGHAVVNQVGRIVPFLKNNGHWG